MFFAKHKLQNVLAEILVCHRVVYFENVYGIILFVSDKLLNILHRCNYYWCSNKTS